jgi:hypothetical protein
VIRKRLAEAEAAAAAQRKLEEERIRMLAHQEKC